MEFVDVPITWRTKNFPNYKQYTKKEPDIEYFLPITEKPIMPKWHRGDRTHMIPVHENKKELKDWLKDNVNNYRMLGRISLNICDYKIEKFFLGYVFVFAAENDAAMFSLRWAHLL